MSPSKKLAISVAPNYQQNHHHNHHHHHHHNHHQEDNYCRSNNNNNNKPIKPHLALDPHAHRNYHYQPPNNNNPNNLNNNYNPYQRIDGSARYPAAAITDLPDDCLLLIFHLLPLRDLLTHIPRVCARWRAAYQQACRLRKKLCLLLHDHDNCVRELLLRDSILAARLIGESARQNCATADNNNNNNNNNNRNNNRNLDTKISQPLDNYVVATSGREINSNFPGTAWSRLELPQTARSRHAAIRALVHRLPNITKLEVVQMIPDDRFYTQIVYLLDQWRMTLHSFACWTEYSGDGGADNFNENRNRSRNQDGARGTKRAHGLLDVLRIAACDLVSLRSLLIYDRAAILVDHRSKSSSQISRFLKNSDGAQDTGSPAERWLTALFGRLESFTLQTADPFAVIWRALRNSHVNDLRTITIGNALNNRSDRSIFDCDLPGPNERELIARFTNLTDHLDASAMPSQPHRYNNNNNNIDNNEDYYYDNQNPADYDNDYDEYRNEMMLENPRYNFPNRWNRIELESIRERFSRLTTVSIRIVNRSFIDALRPLASLPALTHLHASTILDFDMGALAMYDTVPQAEMPRLRALRQFRLTIERCDSHDTLQSAHLGWIFPAIEFMQIRFNANDCLECGYFSAHSFAAAGDHTHTTASSSPRNLELGARNRETELAAESAEKASDSEIYCAEFVGQVKRCTIDFANQWFACPALRQVDLDCFRHTGSGFASGPGSGQGPGYSPQLLFRWTKHRSQAFGVEFTAGDTDEAGCDRRRLIRLL